MSATLFGDGAKGMRLQMFENATYQVWHSAHLPERGADWQHCWKSERTGDQEFGSYAELRTAYNS